MIEITVSKEIEQMTTHESFDRELGFSPKVKVMIDSVIGILDNEKENYNQAFIFDLLYNWFLINDVKATDIVSRLYDSARLEKNYYKELTFNMLNRENTQLGLACKICFGENEISKIHFDLYDIRKDPYYHLTY